MSNNNPLMKSPVSSSKVPQAFSDQKSSQAKKSRKPAYTDSFGNANNGNQT
jgi:hypothetical protein